MILFFDTETTGVPRNYKVPASDVESWPRLVQLGFIVMDDKNPLLETEYVVYPSFEIPAEASRVHGITTERARDIGQPIGDILGNFKFWVENCDVIVGHNVDFDVHVVGAEFIRLLEKDPFEGKKIVCTMQSSTRFCGIPNGRGSFKWPKLHELYRKLFDRDMGAAHTALQDIQNTAQCYFELVERGVI